MRLGLRLFLLAAGLSSLAGTTHAQHPRGTVLVHVRHAAAPIAGAELRSEGVRSTSDARGTARLELPAGERSIAITRPGFADTTLVLAVRPGQETTLTVELREKALEAEAIVVTATRSGRVVDEQPIRVDAVPQEEIQENQTIAPGNLTTLLSELPGVRVQESAPGLGGAGLTIRGMPSRMTQVLVDGLPLFGAEPDAFSLLQMPPLDLARVEVVKGIASALYGGSALGGVLNLVSQRADGEASFVLNRTSRGGTDLVGFAPGHLGQRWGYTVTAGAHAQARSDLDHDGWAELAGYRRVLLRPRIFWDDGAGRAFLATAGMMAENRTGGGAGVRQELETQRVDGGATGHALLKNGMLLSGRGSAVRQQHQRSFAERRESDEQTSFFTEATLAGSTAGHNWLVGSALEYDALRAPGLVGVEYTYMTPALFAQDEVSPTDWFSATLSTRVDVQNVFGTFFSPRLSTLFRPGGGFGIRASAGLGWAAPRPWTEEVEAVGLSPLLPLRGLRAEEARSGAVDLGWSGGAWELSGSVFAARVLHPLAARTVDIGSTARLELYSGTAPRDTRGAEALARYTQGALHLLGSYTYLDASERDAVGRRQRTERIPRHSGEIAALLEEEAVGRVGIEVAYTGRMRIADDPYRSVSRPYAELNALAAKNFGETQIYLNAINLLDVRQSRFDPLLRPSPSALGAPATDVWAPLAGRTFNLGVRVVF
jgi:iron complex outermembrane receptor protein